MAVLISGGSFADNLAGNSLSATVLVIFCRSDLGLDQLRIGSIVLRTCCLYDTSPCCYGSLGGHCSRSSV